jgi:D-3-phosphoglycerate dehydrogenase / 2-oxoglutarate reductase
VPLRAVGPWHAKIQAGHETWPMEQFSDNPYLLNGELYGKRLGVFGLGRIGQYYAKLARVFEAELAAYDPYVG